MPTTRISGPSREVLQRLAEETGESVQAILDKAIEMYRRHRFLEKANLAFEALRANRKAWKEELAERQAWDIALRGSVERD